MNDHDAHHALTERATEKQRWAEVLGAPTAQPKSPPQPTEADLIAGDLAANVNKAQRAYAAQERNAMRLQLQHQSLDYP